MWYTILGLSKLLSTSLSNKRNIWANGHESWEYLSKGVRE